ncbi:hypothetical protein QTP88_030064 [Uroleucon formosanum]
MSALSTVDGRSMPTVVVTGNGESGVSIPEREPEKRLPHPRKAAGAQITHSRNGEELTEGHHQEWSLRLNLTQHGKPHQARTPERLTD